MKYDVREAKEVHDMNVSLYYRSHMQVRTLKQNVIKRRHCIQRALDRSIYSDLCFIDSWGSTLN